MTQRIASCPGQPAPARSAPVLELMPFDNVTILRQPEFDLHRTVWITGEIRFPGPYASCERTSG
jgi:hypothetical protein